MCLTGNGTTFALTAVSGGATPPTTIGSVISIGGWNPMLTEIEDNDITSTGLVEYCPGDLITHEPIDIAIKLDPDVQMPILLTKLGILYIGTLTFSLPAGKVTGASLTGSGYLVGPGWDGIANNERSEGTMKWRWDNKGTALAFTASSAS